MVSRVKRDFKFDDAFHPMCYFKLVHGSMQRGCLSKVPISLEADTVRRFINHMISDYCLT